MKYLCSSRARNWFGTVALAHRQPGIRASAVNRKYELNCQADRHTRGLDTTHTRKKNSTLSRFVCVKVWPRAPAVAWNSIYSIAIALWHGCTCAGRRWRRLVCGACAIGPSCRKSSTNLIKWIVLFLSPRQPLPPAQFRPNIRWCWTGTAGRWTARSWDRWRRAMTSCWRVASLAVSV